MPERHYRHRIDRDPKRYSALAEMAEAERYSEKSRMRSGGASGVAPSDSIDPFEAHPDDAGPRVADALEGCFRQVDDPPTYEGATVIDAHDHAFAVASIGDPNVRAEGQAAMGGGERPLIETLAAGGQLAVVLASIVRGFSGADMFAYGGWRRRTRGRTPERGHRAADECGGE